MRRNTDKADISKQTEDVQNTVNAYPTDEELRIKAHRNEEMPDGLNIEDQMLFQNLRLLYQQNARGDIDAAKGKKEIKKIFSARDKFRQKQAFQDKLQAFTSQLWHDIDDAASRYALSNQSGNTEAAIKAADEMYNSIYRLTPKI